jgi:hypothetical protein
MYKYLFIYIYKYRFNIILHGITCDRLYILLSSTRWLCFHIHISLLCYEEHVYKSQLDIHVNKKTCLMTKYMLLHVMSLYLQIKSRKMALSIRFKFKDAYCYVLRQPSILSNN